MIVKGQHARSDAPKVAARILDAFGSSLANAQRPGDGQSNTVWLAGGIVLRMGGNDGALLREAALAALLPSEAGYPAVLGSGVLDGWEWIVARRLPGEDLSARWPSLDVAQQRLVLDEVWQRLAAVHRTDVEQARRLGCTSTPFYALERNVATQQLAVCRAAGALDDATLEAIERVLAAMHGALPGVPEALSHTDAHPGNTVWDGRHNAIPIDYEFASIAPGDLDVEIVFRGFAAEPGSAAWRHLAHLAQPELARAGARERIVGYAVLRDVWGLTKWLHNMPHRNDWETWQPWLNLQAHLAGTSWVTCLWP